MKPLVFVGVDTGLEGAFASLTYTGQVTAVHLAVMPTRDRLPFQGGGEDKGREVLPEEARTAAREVAPNGWRRCLIERPVRGGMARQGTGVEFAQGDAHGVARTVLSLNAALLGYPQPEAVGVSGHTSWHSQLAMESAKKAGKDRKALSIDVAEALLSMLAAQGATVHGLKPCRGYDGLIGGQQAPRSGAADALLLAWLALRLELGVPAGAPTHCLDPAWRPEPKPPRVRAPRKPPHTPPAPAPKASP